jgi:transcriptional regulator of met regulon
MKKILVSVKKVLKMINECQDQEQIDNCRIVVQNYVKSAKKQGLANVDDLKNRLEEEISQRQEEIMLVKIFNT